MGTNDDHGKLRPANVFNHVKITVAISRIERLDGHRNQEITLSRVANALAFRRMTDAVDFMHGMAHVIGEGRLLQSPLRIGLCKRREPYQEESKQDLLHYHFQNFR